MKQDEVYEILKHQCIEQQKAKGQVIGISAEEVAEALNMKRPNVLREFKKLVELGLVDKKEGRPVLYFINPEKLNVERSMEGPLSVFDKIIGKDTSLKHPISLAKAAIVYPPRGLHTLIVGETGVGKSFFAKCMFKYAIEINRIKDINGFAVFNCADYANNPHLLISHLFGVKKGAYTGAVEDREGIIEKARDGVLFLDEVHRLPPEGQEMLFTLIDEGKYTPLGSTKDIPISIMIVCATTEDINSTLLKTFTRRIPVTISLPALRERTVEERMCLIESFFEEESKRVMKRIDISEDSITALLNYECLNNIGQLKSDIQIACAKAYLRSMFEKNLVKVELGDFPDEVKSGLLIAKKVKPVYLNLEINNDIFNEDEEEFEDKYSLTNNIYDFIEKRKEYLKGRGLEEKQIQNKLSDEVESYINNYLTHIKSSNKEDEIKRIVNNELYDFLSSFIYFAEYKLGRKISKNTFLGLLIHIDTFLGRIGDNKIIENPKIDEIRKKYPKEFKLAIVLSDKLEQKYDIDVPIDEIGFITMFFAAEEEEEKGRVAVLVAMHGKSTASSMAEVTNTLLNTTHAIGFDMPLSMKPEEALYKIQHIIKEKNEGMGAILLVDMGSLKFFDKMITENTGIKVKAIDMVTTATVIEATRKAIMFQSLEEIVKSVDLESKYLGNFLSDNIKHKKDVIITACTTGEGTAQKIKEMIFKKYSEEKYDVINLSMKDKNEFIRAVENIRKDCNVVSIISAFDLKIEGINYISMEKFFKDFLGEDFEESENNAVILKNIKTVYKDYLDLPHGDFVAEEFMQAISTMKYIYGIHLDGEKLNGLLMHFGCLVQKLVNREERPKCRNINTILSRHYDLYAYLEGSLRGVKEKLDINFSQDDIGNILEILINM
ncbi:sigma-54-dependent transcriptional regulator [Desnuesiella massiliensis]|uniref:sigma-54-dependent transcriptional regulator n=1 Tax=Desnuesiella massiliensis TaxID=1650662 RepID=UPI0006E42507|nr:sigma 54-interacting transcriptional regulator [Desnuesiella massiliensis]